MPLLRWLKPDPGPSKSMSSRGMRLVAGCLMAVGFLARVAPLADHGGRLLRMLPSEDGYLMLTIARNLAQGHGMSTADGTMPTNGTQPLATFLWSACSYVVGGDKVRTVAAVLIAELLLSTATAFAIYKLARRVLGDSEAARESAMLAAGGWYASATLTLHTMNCLETGLYALVVATLLAIVFGPSEAGKTRQPGDPGSSPRWGRWARIGALLGVAFWARNDAVLLCMAVAGVHLGWGLPGAPPRPLHRVLEVAVAAGIVTVVALPWLSFNYLRFGHLMPVSGRAESLDAHFGGNLTLVPATLIAYATLFLPVPAALLRSPPVVALSLAALAACAWFTWKAAVASGRAAERQAWLVGVTLICILGAFYGLFFGAPHFMSRYMVPTSPLYAVAWGALVHAGARKLEGRSVALLGGAFALLALPVALHVRNYLQVNYDPHFQVADWVTANVPESVWIGAPQSGTVGYLHDRTVNLDGKVNPAALAALEKHALPQYVVDSDIEYVADWEVLLNPEPLPGVSITYGEPPMAQFFEVVVDDKTRDLGVLRRKARATASAR